MRCWGVLFVAFVVACIPAFVESCSTLHNSSFVYNWGDFAFSYVVSRQGVAQNNPYSNNKSSNYIFGLNATTCADNTLLSSAFSKNGFTDKYGFIFHFAQATPVNNGLQSALYHRQCLINDTAAFSRFFANGTQIAVEFGYDSYFWRNDPCTCSAIVTLPSPQMYVDGVQVQFQGKITYTDTTLWRWDNAPNTNQEIEMIITDCTVMFTYNMYPALASGTTFSVDAGLVAFRTSGLYNRGDGGYAASEHYLPRSWEKTFGLCSVAGVGLVALILVVTNLRRMPPMR